MTPDAAASKRALVHCGANTTFWLYSAPALVSDSGA